MLIRRLVSIAGTAILLLSAASAQAGDFGKRGLYAGVNAAYGIDLFSAEIANIVVGPIPGVTINNSAGLNARLGYRAFSALALELQYEWMSGIDILFNGTEAGTYKPHVITGNVKLFLPTWRVQPYLLAGGGVGIWNLDFSPAVAQVAGVSGVEGTGFAFRGGAGLDLYLTESLALNAEGTAVLNTSGFQVSLVDTSLYYFSVSAGLAYHF